MGMYDHYVPSRVFACPVCKTPLDGWQSKVSECRLATFEQGAEPKGPLPRTFRIYTGCDGCQAWVEALSITDPEDGVWRWTSLDTYVPSAAKKSGEWDETPVLDPYRVETAADLSREDHAVLYRECRGRRVVEFGAGGSTEYLSRFVEALHSVETDSKWGDLAMRAATRLMMPRGVPLQVDTVQPYDLVQQVLRVPDWEVHFVDGRCDLRAPWVRMVLGQRSGGGPYFRELRTILVHDTRRPEPLASMGFLLQWPYTALIRSMEFEGNLLVIRLRRHPVKYENWNETEPDGRRALR